MTPKELLELAVDQQLAVMKPVRKLDASCCLACNLELVDFDEVKNLLCSGLRQMPKSCDGVLAYERSMLWVEMKDIVKTWDDTNREYKLQLQGLNITSERLRFTPLHELGVPDFPRDLFLNKVKDRFNLPEKYFDSCGVLDILACRLDKSVAWNKCHRSDEFVFLYNEARDNELILIILEDVPNVFKDLFVDIDTKLSPLVQNFTPLMLSCTEFETKYTPAKA